jgi:hypothetical protein
MESPSRIGDFVVEDALQHRAARFEAEVLAADVDLVAGGFARFFQRDEAGLGGEVEGGLAAGAADADFLFGFA